MMKDTITIGRSSMSDILVDEQWDTVSNNHASLSWRDDTLIFTDHSRNGSTVRGQIVHNREVFIYPGDQIRLGGAYELQWSDIRRYFPQISRPTVEKNVRVEDKISQYQSSNSDNSRRTLPLDKDPSGRKTECLSNKEELCSNHAQEVKGEGLSYIPSHAELEQNLNKWNWGAFFCGWLWAVCHKLYWPLIIIVVGFIPYLGQIIQIVFAVWLGINGNSIAWKSRRYKSFGEMRHKQKIWGWVGLVVFSISVLMSVWSTIHILSL